MAHVNTLLGPVHPEEMGITAIHEHIMWGPSGWEHDPDSWFNFNIMFEECYHQLMDFKLLGGQTYVDCSGIGMGRDLDVYIKLADSIRQLHIVASTGFDADDGIAPYFRTKDMDYFEELFIHEITKGMGHTSVKAGIISVGNGGTGSFTKLGEMVYRAAARAAKRTGAAVIAHGAWSPLKQLEILTNEKLDPSRIIISHLVRIGDRFPL